MTSEMGTEKTAEMKDAPACEVGMCIFRASINLYGKWVCEHHAPSQASYLRKYGKSEPAAPPVAERKP